MVIAEPQFWPSKTLAIFAHPDDESFGPGGTIAKLAQTGEVHLLCVTDGNDPTREEHLTQTRHQELQAAAQALGVSRLQMLGYADGSLNNQVYHEVAEQILAEVEAFQPEVLITFEPGGVSGHLDHIALAYITRYVFEQSNIPQQLWYYCISDQMRLTIEDYFIFFPPGYDRSEVDLIVDTNEVWPQQLQAIRAHHSQLKDGENMETRLARLPHEELFLVVKRDLTQVAE